MFSTSEIYVKIKFYYILAQSNAFNHLINKMFVQQLLYWELFTKICHPLNRLGQNIGSVYLKDLFNNQNYGILILQISRN